MAAYLGGHFEYTKSPITLSRKKITFFKSYLRKELFAMNIVLPKFYDGFLAI